MIRRVLPGFFVVAAFLVAGCGGGSGGGSAPAPPVTTTTPPSVASAFVPGTTGVTQIASSTGAIGTTLLPSSADGMFIMQAASSPVEQFTTSPTVTTYNVTVSESSGLSTSSIKRAASVDGRVNARLSNDRETLWERPLNDTARTAAYLKTIRGSATAARRPLAGTSPAPSPLPAVGATRVFKILASSIGNSGGTCPYSHPGYDCYTDITATLEAQGAHGNVWVDQKSINTPNEFPSGSADFTTVATDFDKYYATETQIFGSPFLKNSIDFTPQCDASGTTLTGQDVVPDLTGTSGDTTGQRIDIVITDVLAGTGEGGYFFGGNNEAQQVLNCQTPPRQVSNETFMFVMGGDNYLPTDPAQHLSQFNENYWLTTDVPRAMSHELQHLVHFTNKVLGNILAGGSGTQDDAFIDEGTSMLAEDLAANGTAIDTPRYSYSYMLEPADFALTSFTGYQPNPTSTASTTPPYGYFTNTAGSYGFSYLMMRYVYDRFGGAAAIQRLYASQTPHTGPLLAAANGEPFAQFYGEFTTAIANQAAGTGAVSTDPRFVFGPEITLRGPVNITSRRDPPYDTRHLVFGGPLPPETFSGGVPNGFVSLAPGQSLSLSLIDGATMYFPLAGAGSAGATLRGSGGPATTQGAIVQGQVPTPQPTSY